MKVPGPTPAPTDPRASGEAAEKPACGRRWLTAVVVVVLVFALGFVPMWLKANRHAKERDTARREVVVLQLESGAAGAAPALSGAQQAALKPLLTGRDDRITLLARNDPAAAEQPAKVQLACRRTLRGPPTPPAN